MQKVLLITFYDQICLGARQILSVLKKNAIEGHLIIFKSERTAVIPNFIPISKHYQIKVGPNLIGCGEDINPLSTSELQLGLNYIKNLKPNIIGISCRSVNLEIARLACEKIRSILPDTKLIAGGIGPTSNPLPFLEFVNYVAIGEGEYAFPSLFEYELQKVPGLCWVKNGVLISNKPSAPVNLDNLPPPEWDSINIHLIEDNKITKLSFIGGTYDIFSSRGCPSTCTYCCACQYSDLIKRHGTVYPRWRQRSIKSTINELLVAKQKYDIQYVRFKDSIFTVNKQWVKEFLDIYNKVIKLPFHCFLDQRFIDDELVKILKSSGLDYTTVGIQSVNRKIRKEIMGRNITDEELIEYACMLEKHDVKIKYDIIGWNHFETRDHLEQGMGFLSRLPKGIIVTIYQLKIFPSTRLAGKFLEYKPTPLSDEEYLRFATLYQMILHSKELEDIAYRLFKSSYPAKELNRIFKAELDRIDDGYRMISRRNICTGEKLRVVDFKLIKSNEDGLRRKDIENVLHGPLRKDIPALTILRSEHFFGSSESNNI